MPPPLPSPSLHPPHPASQHTLPAKELASPSHAQPVAVLGCVLLHLIGSRLRIEMTCLAGVVRTVHPSSCSFLPFPFRLDATSVPHKTCLSESHLAPPRPLPPPAHLQPLRVQPLAVKLPELPHITNCKHLSHSIASSDSISFSAPSTSCKPTYPPCQRKWQVHLMRNLWQSSAVSSCT